MTQIKFFVASIVLFTLFSCGGQKHITKTDNKQSLFRLDTTSTVTQTETTSTFEETYKKSSSYRAAYNKTNDLLHTKLDVRFDWAKQYLYGKEWVTLKPHFYPTDSLTLDAKHMDIAKVELMEGGKNTTLNYKYDSTQIHITLNKTYTVKDSFTVYIEYTSKPNSIKSNGSMAITDDKGLYFINPDGKDPNKPRELWTQGETESSSVWFPTIDKPDMKTTLDINITADTGMSTLSNGTMVSTKNNGDGTHTDNWKLDKPFAPYLVMMSVGHFAITKDKWRNIEVSYYTDPAYGKYARDIFGHTPEMIEFYSKKFGFDYPWPKYSQIVVHDFVSGAMENVTATVHYEGLQQTKRDMIDGDHEDIICHELSHHWFGDLVTCKSWSNLPLNESFATYNEYLWLTYKRGQDEGDAHIQGDLDQYLGEAERKQVPLIRYHYADKEDMFDGHSYQKGGCVLHMLNNYVGDDAYTKALSLYLNTNKYKAVEIEDLQKAFEDVTGQDLHWFFDEWFHRAGHPVVEFDHFYSEASHKVTVVVRQHSSDTNEPEDKFKPWKFPVAIDIYSGNDKKRYTVWSDSASQAFTFPVTQAPDLVNVEADKVLLCKKSDNKKPEEWVYQYFHAPLYLDRWEAIQYFVANQFSDETLSINNIPATVNSIRKAMVATLDDKFWRLRKDAIEGLDMSESMNGLSMKGLVRDKLMAMAKSDPSSNVRAEAISKLAQAGDSTYISLYRNGLRDSSYAVDAASLTALDEASPKEGLKAAKQFENEKNEAIGVTVMSIYAASGDSSVTDFFIKKLSAAGGTEKFSDMIIFGRYLSKLDIGSAQKALPVLYNTASNEDQWIVRFSAMNALETVKNAWVMKINDLNDALRNMKETDSNYQGMKSKMESWRAKEADLEKKIADIKANESNDLLKSFYKGHN